MLLGIKSVRKTKYYSVVLIGTKLYIVLLTKKNCFSTVCNFET